MKDAFKKLKGGWLPAIGLSIVFAVGGGYLLSKSNHAAATEVTPVAEAVTPAADVQPVADEPASTEDAGFIQELKSDIKALYNKVMGDDELKAEAADDPGLINPELDADDPENHAS